MRARRSATPVNSTLFFYGRNIVLSQISWPFTKISTNKLCYALWLIIFGLQLPFLPSAQSELYEGGPCCKSGSAVERKQVMGFISRIKTTMGGTHLWKPLKTLQCYSSVARPTNVFLFSDGHIADDAVTFAQVGGLHFV